VGVFVGTAVSVGVLVEVDVGVFVGSPVFVGVLVGVCEGVAVAVGVLVDVGSPVGVCVGVGVFVGVDVGVCVDVGTPVGVCVAVGVFVRVIVGVAVRVGVDVPVELGVNVAVAVGILWVWTTSCGDVVPSREEKVTPSVLSATSANVYVPLPVTREVTLYSTHALVPKAPTLSAIPLSKAGFVFQVTPPVPDSIQLLSAR
jgi:hypothetical protein